ncbi:MAG: hypothetical protein AB8F94_10040 [Saprospiraceae bacterium]
MKMYPQPSKYFYVDIFILLCLIYFITSAFISIEVLKEMEIIGDNTTTIPKYFSCFLNQFVDLNFKDFLIDVAWYLFFYILLEMISKVFSILEIIAKIIGNPIKINIKLLNKYCTLLLLILAGKFLVFLITSLF